MTGRLGHDLSQNQRSQSKGMTIEHIMTAKLAVLLP